MDVYVLDSLYQRARIIDEYNSLIWTERYSAYGDFKMVVAYTPTLRGVLSPGRCLTHPETDRIMMVENVSVKNDAEGAPTMTVTGRSIEALLDTRTISTHIQADDLSWRANGTVGELVTHMVNQVCVQGTGLTPLDIIPELYTNDGVLGNESFTVAIKPQSLYQAVKDLCDSRGVGFRIQLLPTSPKLRFNVYKGQYRPNVAFSATLDNLAEEEYYNSNAEFRNVAYVFSKDGAIMETVMAPNVSVYIEGLTRRAMVVDATDIEIKDVPEADIRLLLRQRGLEALAAHKKIKFFDGELTDINPYRYKYDYSLGDIVTKMDEYNNKSLTVVTEHIWSNDSQGLRSYPTFSELES